VARSFLPRPGEPFIACGCRGNEGGPEYCRRVEPTHPGEQGARGGRGTGAEQQNSSTNRFQAGSARAPAPSASPAPGGSARSRFLMMRRAAGGAWAGGRRAQAPGIGEMNQVFVHKSVGPSPPRASFFCSQRPQAAVRKSAVSFFVLSIQASVTRLGRRRCLHVRAVSSSEPRGEWLADDGFAPFCTRTATSPVTCCGAKPDLPGEERLIVGVQRGRRVLVGQTGSALGRVGGRGGQVAGAGGRIGRAHKGKKPGRIIEKGAGFSLKTHVRSAAVRGTDESGSCQPREGPLGGACFDRGRVLSGETACALSRRSWPHPIRMKAAPTPRPAPVPTDRDPVWSETAGC